MQALNQVKCFLNSRFSGFIGSEGSFGFQAALDVNGIGYAPAVEAKPMTTKQKKTIEENQPDLFGELA